jgi:hypothetical protein
LAPRIFIRVDWSAANAGEFASELVRIVLSRSPSSCSAAVDAMAPISRCMSSTNLLAHLRADEQEQRGDCDEQDQLEIQ